MRILIAHNFYQQAGGEDVVYAAEAAMLERSGHHVVRYEMHNDAVDGMGRGALLMRTLWSRRSRREIARLVEAERIDVAHFHNTFPLISPAALYGARQAGAAVVQTLHNHRLMCVNGVLYRDGQVCDDCAGRWLPLPGIAHKCYRGSRSASAAVAAMLALHRALGTWKRQVDLFIVPSQSTRQRLSGAGLPADRVVVKPHFVDPDPGIGAGEEGYFLFVGRLSPEKGVDVLLRAWAMLPAPPELRVIGDGPMAALVREARDGIRWLGRRTQAEVQEAIGRAAAVVVPSPCHETFGRVVAEAFSRGTPVVASDCGALREMVEEGATGVRFASGDAGALAHVVKRLVEEPQRLCAMRPAARREYEARYTAESNYDQLIRAYNLALARRRGAVADPGYDELGRRAPLGPEAGGDAGGAGPEGDVLHPPLVPAPDLDAGADPADRRPL